MIRLWAPKPAENNSRPRHLNSSIMMAPEWLRLALNHALRSSDTAFFRWKTVNSLSVQLVLLYLIQKWHDIIA
jgi:hypothetical protein